ncbi:MAG: hypothetical protein SGILL_008318 [Bacillariaceae sp.]
MEASQDLHVDASSLRAPDRLSPVSFPESTETEAALVVQRDDHHSGEASKSTHVDAGASKQSASRGQNKRRKRKKAQRPNSNAETSFESSAATGESSQISLPSKRKSMTSLRSSPPGSKQSCYQTPESKSLASRTAASDDDVFSFDKAHPPSPTSEKLSIPDPFEFSPETENIASTPHRWAGCQIQPVATETDSASVSREERGNETRTTAASRAIEGHQWTEKMPGKRHTGATDTESVETGIESDRNLVTKETDPRVVQDGVAHEVAQEGESKNTHESFQPDTVEAKISHGASGECLVEASDASALEDQPMNGRRKTDDRDSSPSIKLPPELMPFNRPGRSDYAIILKSRLRNRNKKANVEEDVPYQHVNAQRRCQATLSSARTPLPNGQNGNQTQEQCQNCAVGMSDYCHGHRDLEQNYRNNPARCVAINKDKRRCSRNVKGGEKCCYRHRSLENLCTVEQTSEVYIDKKLGAVRCVADASGQCSSKTVDRRVVFCPIHMQDAPVKCFPLASEEESGESKECEEPNEPEVDVLPADAGRITDDVSEPAPAGGIFTGAQCGDTENESGDRYCSESNLRSDQWSRFNVDTRRVRNRCVFVNGSNQCSNHAHPGSLMCTEHGGTNEHQGNVNIFDIFTPTMNEPIEDSINELSISQSNHPLEEDSDNEVKGMESRTSSDESDESTIDSLSGESNASTDMYTRQEFEHLWEEAERLFGDSTDEIEDSKLVRAANQKMDPADTEGQAKAQYGRLLPRAMKRMMKVLELNKDDVFLDIGHGIGNTCLHAAFCIGCEARGIEVVAGRHSIAKTFHSELERQNASIENPIGVGKVELRLGQLEDPQHKDFLTQGVTKAYVNNFNGVFAERSTKLGQKYFLDDYVAGLFALLQPGAIMVTFHPISLCLDLNEANEARRKHGMEDSANASFYEYERVPLGQAYKTVKWKQISGNTKEIYVYKYRRLLQDHGGEAVFLCSNPKCKNAIDNKPITASIINEEGRYVMNHCPCRVSPKNLRRRSPGKAGVGGMEDPFNFSF